MVGYGPGGAAVVVTASGFSNCHGTNVILYISPWSYEMTLTIGAMTIILVVWSYNSMIIWLSVHICMRCPRFRLWLCRFFVQDRSDDGQHESNSCGPHWQSLDDTWSMSLRQVVPSRMLSKRSMARQGSATEHGRTWQNQSFYMFWCAQFTIPNANSCGMLWLGFQFGVHGVISMCFVYVEYVDVFVLLPYSAFTQAISWRLPWNAQNPGNQNLANTWTICPLHTTSNSTPRHTSPQTTVVTGRSNGRFQDPKRRDAVTICDTCDLFGEAAAFSSFAQGRGL